MKDMINVYKKHVEETTAAIKALNKKINRYSLLRLLVIIVGAILVFQAVQTEAVWLVMLAFFAAILSFVWLVFQHSRLEKRKVELSDFLLVNQNELDMHEGKPNRYPDGGFFAESRHPYSDDLDIYGPSSLFALANRSATLQANRQLAAWLRSPADRETIGKRQETVRELAADLEWCQQFQSKLVFNLQNPLDYKKHFTNYLEADNLNFGNRLLRFYVKTAPWLVAAAIGLAFFIPSFSSLVVFLAMAHLLAALGCAGRVSLISGKVDKTGNVLAAFAESFSLIENRKWESRLGVKLSSYLFFGDDRKPVSAVFKELAVLIERLDYRLNMLMGAVLNMVFLWDFKQVFAILDWRERYKADMLHVFDVASEMEVLGSLAALVRNHPDWTFPEIQESNTQYVEAVSLAHPLISNAKAVPNDYRMEDHRIALITGSNMAGKSTFLRTVGINAVLAFSGAPVCAKHMRLSVFNLVTYMRIKDSLNESTSTFKAELDRMQLILETVKNQPDTYFLIDEMLRGTNSVDKYRGSKAIIKKLIVDQGVGMVATHDLQLAKLADEYPAIVRNYHFDIQVRDGEMLFDYKLKDGECTIFNASLLLKGIGIEVEER